MLSNNIFQGVTHMSFVTAQPEALTASWRHLAGIGPSMAAENDAAAAPRRRVIPAAAARGGVRSGGSAVRHLRPDVSSGEHPSIIREHLGDQRCLLCRTEAASAVAAT